MTKSACSEEDFIRLYRELGATETAKALGLEIRGVHARRARIEKGHGISIEGPKTNRAEKRSIGGYPRRLETEIKNGIVVIASDAHYWPGEPDPGHKALIKVIEMLKPHSVIMNGDVLDGAKISRHPPLMWSHTPTLKDELNTVDERLDEIRKAAKDAILYWVIGNHDSRFENKLCAQVPEFANVNGMKLVDHFPHWTFTFSLWINSHTVVKHRFRSGIHCAFMNTLWSGKSLIAGHTHSLKVTPFSDYNGTRYGVDCSTLSEPYGEHTAYTEDNPLNHRSGFCVLTFHNGELLWPELVSIMDKKRFQFRGQVYDLT